MDSTEELTGPRSPGADAAQPAGGSRPGGRSTVPVVTPYSPSAQRPHTRMQPRPPRTGGPAP